MILLALDTSDARGSVAVLRDEQILQTMAHETAEDYSSWVLPAVQRLLAANQLKMQDVEVYAVSTGPGSFTGLRIGLTSVKAWSEAYGAKIAAVSRLEAIASQAQPTTEFIAAFFDAQREQIFGGLFRREGSSLQRVEDEMVIAPDGFLQWVSERTVAASGVVAQLYPEPQRRNAAPQLGNDGATGVTVAWVSMDPEKLTHLEPWRAHADRGEAIQLSSHVLAPAIGRIGLQRAKEGHLIDALALDAQYVRRSDAEIFWKGHAAK